MARKKEEPIKGVGKNPSEALVQKSRPLYALWRSGLTLAEFKILDTYLARIDSHNPKKRVVVFEKGEIEKLLEVKKINNKDLKKRLMHLMGHVVEVDDPTKTKSFRLVTLFEEAVCEQDENGLWKVRMECTQKAMKYFFNPEAIGYIKYKLKSIMAIKSRYSYNMFVCLQANRYRKTYTIDLQELKEILGCDKEEFYNEFKFFNRNILKKTHKELNEKTECKYNYEPVKKGRSVVAIKFTLETQPKIETGDIDIVEPENIDANRELWESALDDFEFSPEQLAELREVLVCVPENKLPQKEEFYGNLDIVWYHYVAMKVAEIKRRRNIKNKFQYLIKMMKNDAKTA